MKEHILCAALHYDNGIEYVHQPKNIKSGMVFCGRRHHNCFIPLETAFPERKKTDVKQGFITSLDRYVDRKEAMEIAIAAGQVDNDETNIGMDLISEDLY